MTRKAAASRSGSNWAQEALLDELHHQNVILKARQLGFTTFIQLFMLDACLFNSNIRAGTIAHRLDDAKTIFRDKVKYPYDNLPDRLKAARPIVKDSADELLFANNSSIRVGTSMRSGTLQYLHISEYGKLCAQFPDKAREMRTGALNTVQAGQVVFLESTAEGRGRPFLRAVRGRAGQAADGHAADAAGFQVLLLPVVASARNTSIDPAGVIIPEPQRKYFEQLEATHGIVLTPAQQAWYVKKAETQLGDMKREYPSTPEEAFEASVEGAYYGEQMAAAELQGRIGNFPADPDLPVHTAWDIGRHDYTAIWFWQRLLAKRIRLVGYFQNTGEGMPYYADELRKLYEAKGWRRKGAVDYVPHDARVTEWGTDRSRIEQMFMQRLNPQIATELTSPMASTRCAPSSRLRVRRPGLRRRHQDVEELPEGMGRDQGLLEGQATARLGLARRRRLPLSGCGLSRPHTAATTEGHQATLGRLGLDRQRPHRAARRTARAHPGVNQRWRKRREAGY